ncbi:hypothetical protein Tco_1490867 [Tanacetum coccineum]
MMNGRIQRGRRGMRKRGDFVKKVRVSRFGRLGRWFGLNDGGSTSNSIENSGDMPQVTTQQSHNVQRSKLVLTLAPIVESVQAEAPAQVQANFRGGFISPRQKTKRIVKLKLGNLHFGVDSLVSNAYDL